MDCTCLSLVVLDFLAQISHGRAEGLGVVVCVLVSVCRKHLTFGSRLHRVVKREISDGFDFETTRVEALGPVLWIMAEIQGSSFRLFCTAVEASGRVSTGLDKHILSSRENRLGVGPHSKSLGL